MSLIIGIDPGSRLTGYGIIEKDGINYGLWMLEQSVLKPSHA
jgi:Holliday junction resolvasome RuvABC endonuclease subunit